MSAAREGELERCEDLVRAGLARGIRPSALALGLLQPLLQQVGGMWEAGELDVAEERRASAWCARALEILPGTERLERAHPTLLALPAPGNHHTIGLRLAELALGEVGVRCLTALEPLTSDHLLGEVTRSGASWIGISCALIDQVDAALAMVQALRELGCEVPVILSGHAIRWHELGRSPAPGVTCCRTVQEVIDQVLASPDVPS